MLKKIASNTFAQLVAKFVGAGLTFLTTALIIRLSGTTIFGELTKSLALVAIGFTIIDFGLNAVVVRNFGKGGNLSQNFRELLLTRLLLSVVVVIGINLLIQFLSGGYTGEIKSVFWIGSLAIIFQGVFTSCNAVFQSRENYWKSTIAIILGTTLGAGLTYYYTLHSPTLAHFLEANTVGYFVMALTSLLLTRIPLFKTGKTLSNVLVLFRSALPLGAILLASVVASKIDTIIMGIYRTSSEVGEYGFAYRIFDVIHVLPAFIMNAVYPRLVKENIEKSLKLIKRISVFMFVSGVLIAIVSYYISPLILLIRPNLLLSVASLRVLVLSLPLFFLTAPLMWQQISLHQEKKLLKIYLIAALINGSLNFIFTPTYGAISAAIVTGITELFIYLALLYSGKFNSTKPLNNPISLLNLDPKL